MKEVKDYKAMWEDYFKDKAEERDGHTVQWKLKELMEEKHTKVEPEPEEKIIKVQLSYCIKRPYLNYCCSSLNGIEENGEMLDRGMDILQKCKKRLEKKG